MAVLIKGMEMPENCFDCPCADTEFYECKAAYHYSFPEDEYGAVDGAIPSWCPLVEVSEPKRGDTELLEASNFEL